MKYKIKIKKMTCIKVYLTMKVCLLQSAVLLVMICIGEVTFSRQNHTKKKGVNKNLCKTIDVSEIKLENSDVKNNVKKSQKIVKNYRTHETKQFTDIRVNPTRLSQSLQPITYTTSAYKLKLASENDLKKKTFFVFEKAPDYRRSEKKIKKPLSYIICNPSIIFLKKKTTDLTKTLRKASLSQMPFYYKCLKKNFGSEKLLDNNINFYTPISSKSKFETHLKANFKQLTPYDLLKVFHLKKNSVEKKKQQKIKTYFNEDVVTEIQYQRLIEGLNLNGSLKNRIPPEEDVSKIDEKFIKSLFNIAKIEFKESNLNLNKTKLFPLRTSNIKKTEVSLEKQSNNNSLIKKITNDLNSENDAKNKKPTKQKKYLQEIQKPNISNDNINEMSESSKIEREPKNLTGKESEKDKIKLSTVKSERTIKFNDIRKRKPQHTNYQRKSVEVIEIPFNDEGDKITELWRNETRVLSDNSLLSNDSSESINWDEEVYGQECLGMQSYKNLKRIVENEIKRIYKSLTDVKRNEFNEDEKKENKENQNPELEKEKNGYSKDNLIKKRLTLSEAKKIEKKLYNKLTIPSAEYSCESSLDNKNRELETIVQKRKKREKVEKLNIDLRGRKNEQERKGKVNKAKTEIAALDKNIDKNKLSPSEIIENWSIVRRLEKAFLALGNPNFPNRNVKKTQNDVQISTKSKNPNKSKNLLEKNKQSKHSWSQNMTIPHIPIKDSRELIYQIRSKNENDAEHSNRKISPSEDLKKSKVAVFTYNEATVQPKISNEKIQTEINLKKKITIKDKSTCPKVEENASSCSKRKLIDDTKRNRSSSRNSALEKSLTLSKQKENNNAIKTDKNTVSKISRGKRKDTEDGNLFELSRKETFNVIPREKLDKENISSEDGKRTNVSNSESVRKDVYTKNNQHYPISLTASNCAKLKVDSKKLTSENKSLAPQKKSLKITEQKSTNIEEMLSGDFKKATLKCSQNRNKLNKAGTAGSKTSVCTYTKLRTKSSFLSIEGSNKESSAILTNYGNTKNKCSTIRLSEIKKKGRPSLLKHNKSLMNNFQEEGKFINRKNSTSSTGTYNLGDVALQKQEMPAVTLTKVVSKKSSAPKLSPKTLNQINGKPPAHFQKKRSKYHWERDLKQYREIVKDIMSQYRRTGGLLRQSGNPTGELSDSCWYEFPIMMSETGNDDGHFVDITQYRNKILSEYNTLPIFEYKSKFFESKTIDTITGDVIGTRNLKVVNDLNKEVDFDVKDYVLNVQNVLDSPLYVDIHRVAQLQKTNGLPKDKIPSTSALSKTELKPEEKSSTTSKSLCMLNLSNTKPPSCNETSSTNLDVSQSLCSSIEFERTDYSTNSSENTLK